MTQQEAGFWSLGPNMKEAKVSNGNRHLEDKHDIMGIKTVKKIQVDAEYTDKVSKALLLVLLVVVGRREKYRQSLPLCIILLAGGIVLTYQHRFILCFLFVLVVSL